MTPQDIAAQDTPLTTMHALMHALVDKDNLIFALQLQRDSLAQDIAAFVPSFKPDEQLMVHAQWAHLKGQLAKVDELLHYLTVIPQPPLQSEDHRYD